jgi:hypothetical protein
MSATEASTTSQSPTGKAVEKVYYAWSEIITGAEVDKDSKTIMSRKSIPVGSVVKPSDLPKGQKEFDHFISTGIIRDTPMPHTRLDQSPKNAVMETARKQIEAINKGVGRKR